MLRPVPALAVFALVASGFAAAPAVADDVQPQARPYVVDPAPPNPPAEPAPYKTRARKLAQAATDVFALHSLPGSNRTIYLDFNGHDVTGTFWDGESGLGISGFQGGMDMDGNPGAFSAQERDVIELTWRQVAETYAPFDVDVTTQEPTLDQLNRSSVSDPTYGVRMIFSDATEPHQAICDGGCAGVALIDVFDGAWSNNDEYRDGWVFTSAVNHNARYMAHAASHEVGHTLNLRHDGDAGGEYTWGTPTWGAVMGGVSGSAVVQFSKGEYPGATNTEDDLALITSSGLAHRPDIPVNLNDAPLLAPAPSYSVTSQINHGTDQDLIRFEHACSTPITVTATSPLDGTSASPVLDVQLDLFDGEGEPMASAAPANTLVGGRMEGMGATLEVTPTSGPYALRVGGTASGTPPNGWTRYGSIGTYQLTISGCEGDSPIAPEAPTGLTLAPGENSVHLSWTAPAEQGTSPVTGYEVTIDGRTLTTSNTSLVVDGLAPNTSYIVSVVAVSAHGTSLPASRSFRTKTTNRVPVAPASLTVTPRVRGATLSWTAPTDVGSSPIIGYDIRVGSSVHRVGSTSRGAVVSNLANARTYAVSIAAVNASGSSAVVSRSFRTPGKPTAPRIGLASAGAKGGAVTATARWGTAAANGSPVTAYRVRATLINSRGQAIRHLWSSRLGPSKRSLVMRLPKGRVQFRVVAINAVGQSALSSASRTVMAR